MKKNRKTAGTGQENNSPPPDFYDQPALERALLETLAKGNKPQQIDQLLKILRLPRKAKKRVEAALLSLVQQQKAVRASGGWAVSKGLRTIQGTLSVQKAGMGFVTPADGKGTDVYIHPSAMGDAWHGDTVEVVILPGKRGPNAEGRIASVLHRGLMDIAVYAEKEERGGVWLCIPESPRIPALFQVPSHEATIRKGDLLLIVPGEKVAPGIWKGSLSANLEHDDTPAAQERLTKSAHAIPFIFPPAVIKETGALPEDPADKDLQGREDLRTVGFVTIDGSSAKDFDDAIHVARSATGYRLLVAIADVSQYVAQGSPLDNEARLRGNSYYFPLSVEPMLPEALSNGLCSLVPDRPRLVMVADMDFSRSGEPAGAAFYPAVIRSQARLTYDQAGQALLQKDPEAIRQLEPVLPMLREAEALARLLADLRQKRGSLDFDLPETEFVFSQDKTRVVKIRPQDRHFGHRMIEEFMIAANEAVAGFLEKKGQPVLYRVHERPNPEKLATLMDYLSQSGLGNLKSGKPGKKGKEALPSIADLRNIMKEAEGTPMEYSINRLVLRSMMQARYSPVNERHFGLASKSYCHFTSPIRRYADLLVHRALKRALGLPESATGKAYTPARLEKIAEHLNSTERTAVEAEREINKRLSILFLADKVGENFQGIISGITDFGIFIELKSELVEGMIPLSGLTDDYYEYFAQRQELRGQRTGRIYRVGQPLPVTLISASLRRMEITFGPEESSGQPVKMPRGKRNRVSKE